MEKEFVGYTEALALKKLRFDEPCLAFFWNTGKFYTCADYPHSISYHLQNQLGDYNYDTTSAPLYQQAFRWFREKYNLQSIIIPFAENSIDENSNTLYYYIINKKQFYGFVNAQEQIGFNSQEEAELECLKKLIEIVKQNE
jgi:hypothetical protein